MLRLCSNRRAHFTIVSIKCLIMVRELLTSNFICFRENQSLQQCARKIWNCWHTQKNVLSIVMQARYEQKKGKKLLHTARGGRLSNLHGRSVPLHWKPCRGTKVRRVGFGLLTFTNSGIILGKDFNLSGLYLSWTRCLLAF